MSEQPLSEVESPASVGQSELDTSGPEPEPLDDFEPLPFEDSEIQDVEGDDGEA